MSTYLYLGATEQPLYCNSSIAKHDSMINNGIISASNYVFISKIICYRLNLYQSELIIRLSCSTSRNYHLFSWDTFHVDWLQGFTCFTAATLSGYDDTESSDTDEDEKNNASDNCNP